MKRYIRTKDGMIIDFQEKYEELISLNAICKTKQEFNKRQKQGFRSIYYSEEQWKTLYVFDYGGFYMLDIINQADTIEELCDEFVCFENKMTFHNLETITSSCNLKHLTIYGAIWTDKGLIYVAKMNEKGEMRVI